MAKHATHAVEDCDIEECEFHETCSLCTTMTPLSELKPLGEWNLVCRAYRFAERKATR